MTALHGSVMEAGASAGSTDAGALGGRGVIRTISSRARRRIAARIRARAGSCAAGIIVVRAVRRERPSVGTPSLRRSFCRAANASRMSCPCRRASRSAVSAGRSASRPTCSCRASMVRVSMIGDALRARPLASCAAMAGIMKPVAAASGRCAETFGSGGGRAAPVAMIVMSILKIQPGSRACTPSYHYGCGAVVDSLFLYWRLR